jgi:hypothetical protein
LIPFISLWLPFHSTCAFALLSSPCLGLLGLCLPSRVVISKAPILNCTPIHSELTPGSSLLALQTDFYYSRGLIDYGYVCNYDRPVGKRGRTRRTMPATLDGSEPVVAEADHEQFDRSPSTSAAPPSTQDELERSTANECFHEPHAEQPALSAPSDHGSQTAHPQPDLILPAMPLASPKSFVQPTASTEPLLREQYRCLVPVLPYLDGIIDVSVACDLFDVYFIDPGSSLFKSAPPYILTRIFRRKSLMHPTNPRYVSPALLATILWCCAQTAELPTLLVPGSRQRISKALYDLTMSLINDRSSTYRWRAGKKCSVLEKG